MRQIVTISFVLSMGVVLTVGGCRKPTRKATTSAPASAYDPKNDPLVNPKSLFEPPPDDADRIADDETLYLQLDGSPNTLNPIFGSSLYEMMAAEPLYRGLFTFDKDMIWKVDKDTVAAFTEADDHKTFTVKIKPGLTWHDGQPWNAHDVVYSWREILDPRVPCPAVKTGTDEIVECVALDDLTVKFVQKEALATARWNLSFPIIPKHIYEKEKTKHPDLKTGSYYAEQARGPVGSGPYRLVEWKENDKLVMERWEKYVGTRPHFKRIVFRIIPDANVTLLSFEKESVDVVRQLSPQQFAQETDSETFRRVGYKAWGTQWAFYYIGWNMDGTNPFFADRRVRTAMTHALNLPLIIDKVFYNLATPCHGIYHPNAWMYNPAVKPLGYDPAKSSALLDEAGWTIDDQDGWRYKDVDGKKTRFVFTLTMSQGSKTAPKIAAIYQQDLKKLGIQMKTRTLEWATFLEKVRKHEFQAETAAWGTGTDPDMGWNLWRTEEYKKGRNYGGYSNARVDELFAKGRREFDQAKRAKIYQEIHKLVYDDQPYTFMINAPILSAFNKRIRGVQFSPRGIFGFDPSYSGWWVAKGQAKYATMQP